MTCVICRQAEPERGTTTVTLTRGKLTFVVRTVPARVCPNCGEACIEEATAAKLLTTAEQLAQAGTQVDVREYAA
ncbi:MAG: type II toxin-antitoxin system MqsA family antitoxin [Candidatus Viridilinea halotolerans]|uniref:Type II toxin-antitoxin system MqsA family antitoxin n=1 Tax=Candidatus Viridilinea halotolerans TaxID=2491704 RepID=A0A426U774_9CHLR|nr:MAG: type II toxin-antitoxin system MqsA family antitoxin [Candidatus Viridilinea halotolerans]